MKRLLIFLIFYSSFQIFAQDLIVKTILDQQEYLAGESIFVIVELTNNGNSDIYTQAFDIMSGRSGLEIILVDEWNDTIKPYPGSQPFEYGPGKNKLKAGNTLATFLHLTDWYFNSKAKGISIWGHGSLKPEKYKIKVNYEFRDPLNDQLINNYNSEWNYFSVVEPMDNELDVYNKIVRSDGKRYIDLSPNEENQQLAKIEEIIANYPNSKYIPSLARDMFYLVDENNYKLLDSLMVILLNNYPESNVNVIAIAHYSSKRYNEFKSAEFQNKINKKLMRTVNHFPDIIDKFELIK